MELLSTDRALRGIATLLGGPTHALLLLAAGVALFETGVFVAEWLRPASANDSRAFMRQARRRIDRVDVLARVGPMLGLMGTLIPLGPGLSALGRGDVATLAAAVTAAFDTTVLGLAIGIFGFVLGRARRHLYDRVLDGLEEAQ